jgi:hypothetical protein
MSNQKAEQEALAFTTGPGIFSAFGPEVRALLLAGPGRVGWLSIVAPTKERALEVLKTYRECVSEGTDPASETLRNCYSVENLHRFLDAHTPQDVKDYSSKTISQR